MDTYIQTGLGIIVSVFLFIISYKQTIGAKKERIKSANNNIVETILRRLILEEYVPEIKDISRLIEGKARDYKVSSQYLLNVEQILNTVYTRIFENDLISKEQRDENIQRLSHLFKSKEKNEQNFIQEEYEKVDNRKNVVNYIALVIGVISSMLGVFIVSFNKIVNANIELNSTIVLTLIGSLLTISITYLFFRFKDAQETTDVETPTTSHFKEYIDFEKEVIKTLDKLNIKTILPAEKRDSGFDLIAIIKNEKVAIEIKRWKHRPPISYVKQIVYRLSESMKKNGIKKGLIVTNETFNLNEKIEIENNIDILSIKELKNYGQQKI